MTAFLSLNPCPISKRETLSWTESTSPGSLSSPSSAAKPSLAFSAAPLRGSRGELFDRRDDAVLVVLGQPDRGGQAQRFGDDPRGHLAPNRLRTGVRLALMHRLEDRPAVDALAGHEAHELSAGAPAAMLVEPDRVEPECRLSPWCLRHQGEAGHAGQPGRVTAGDPVLRRQMLVDAFQLRQAQRGRKTGHAV